MCQRGMCVSRRVLIRISFMVFLFSWLVIALGAWTRLNNAGLSCPDWPLCYGHVLAPSHMDGQGLFTLLQGYYEMVHRYLAGLLVLGILAVSWGVFRYDTERRVSRWATIVMLLVLCYQPWLGAMTVLDKLYPAIVSQHLLCGFSLMSLLWWHYASLSHKPIHTPYGSRYLSQYWLAALIALSVQIALGVWTSTNNAAISCSQFPVCAPGDWHMDWVRAFDLSRQLGDYQHQTLMQEAIRRTIQVVHRFGALGVGTVLFLVQALTIIKRPSLRVVNLACCSMALLVIQIVLGIMNAVYARPLLFAIAHTLVAALLLWTIVATIAVLRHATVIQRWEQVR